ncbi:MAG: hypothetical protein ACK4S3_08975 [Parvibaculum sp.]
MAVEVKLNAVVLPHDHKVYKFFPGRDYKHYELIRETSVAFLDIRNLDELGSDPAKWNGDALLNHIATDRVDRLVEKGSERPLRLVRSAGDKATQTFLLGLLFTAKKGDLILMPGRGYVTDVMVGQLLDEPGHITKVEGHGRTGPITYFGRRVKWLRGIEKRRFTDPIVKLLHSQAAFFDIGRSDYEEVYRLTFDNFVYENQFFATFRTSKAIFTPKDSFLTSVWLELFEVLEGARHANENLPKGTIYDLVIDSDIDEGDRDDLSISVQSPGWFRIRSIVAAPLASLALFAMAVQNVSFEEASAATTSAVLVRPVEDDCMGAVDASVRDYIILLGKDRWEQACKLAQQADSEARLKADAKVVQLARKED